MTGAQGPQNARMARERRIMPIAPLKRFFLDTLPLLHLLLLSYPLLCLPQMGESKDSSWGGGSSESSKHSGSPTLQEKPKSIDLRRWEVVHSDGVGLRERPLPKHLAASSVYCSLPFPIPHLMTLSLILSTINNKSHCCQSPNFHVLSGVTCSWLWQIH